MDVKNLVMAVVGMVLAAVMIGGALLPSVASATETERTFSNSEESLFYMEKIENLTNYSFSWVHGSKTIVVNDETMTLPTNPNSYTLVCVTDDMAIRFVDNATAMQVIGETLATSGSTGIYVTVENGNLTLNNGVATITKDNANGFVIMPTPASHVMKSPNQSAYILTSSELLGMGISSIEGVWNVGFSISGTINNLTVTQYSGTNAYDVKNITTSSSEVRGFVDLINIESISFDVENSTSSYSGSVLYNYFIVPTEVTAELVDKPTNTIISLFSVIPLVAVAGLVMVGIYVFISRK